MTFSEKEYEILNRLAQYDVSIPEMLREAGEDEEFIQDVEDLFAELQ